MDVLQVNKLYHPHIGGIEGAVKMLSEGLVEVGHDVSVLASREQGLGHSFELNGVSVRKSTSAGTVQSVPISPSFPGHLYREMKGRDVVHYHLPNPLAVVSAYLTPAPKAHTVVTYHSDIVRQASALVWYRPLLHSFLSEVDRIITTSPRLVDYSEHLDPYTDKIEVIPLAVDIEEYDEGTETLGNVTSPVVLFVGRLNYYKGVEYLIDAMVDVPATLLVVGDGERRGALEARVNELSLNDKVTFLGKVSEETLQRCYATADIFALPSTEPSEAFGIVQLEAMAHGIPVVNTDLKTGVPWVSKDQLTGLTVETEDSKALEAALESLLSDDERREQLGAQAKDRVERHFSRSQLIEATESLYESLL